MKLCATIIDDRDFDELLFAIRNHVKFLPKDTDLLVWTSPDFYLGLIKLGIPNLTSFPLPEKMTIDKYNELLTTSEFWKFYQDYDRVLIFQTDSKLLRGGIEEFYKWDYIGAEWKFPPYRGNGGLSLRNPKVMQHICKTMKYEPSVHGQEDVYYCNIMNGDNRYAQNFMGYPMFLAPVEVCRKFSAESVFSLGSMGCHAIEKYLSPEQCKEIYEQYSE